MNFGQPVMTRNKWLEHIRELREKVQKDSPGEDWDRLAYYSKILFVGSETRNLADAGFKWLQNTKNADALDHLMLRELYMHTARMLVQSVNQFEAIIIDNLEKYPEEEETKGLINVA